MRYRIFLMLVANSMVVPPASAAAPERKVKPLQADPKRTYIEPRLLPTCADVEVLRASVLPPSDRIAVHLQLFSATNPSAYTDQVLHLRSNVLWPVAKIQNSSGLVTQVSLIADKRGRVRREYRVEQAKENQLVVGHHGVILDRTEQTRRGLELHGRAWHQNGDRRAFAALVHRSDIGYTFDLGKLGGHWLRLDVKGDRLLGLSAVSEA